MRVVRILYTVAPLGNMSIKKTKTVHRLGAKVFVTNGCIKQVNINQ